MDLIYADETRKELGVVKNHTFDLAYGSDENDFSLKMALDDYICKEGYFVYIDGTEYGGIIDTVKVDTEGDEVTYTGRTWHGILEKKILEPDAGEDYLYLDGELNAVLADILSRCGLFGLFSASQEDSGFSVRQYQAERYADAYSTIKKMFFSVGAKLKIAFTTDKVVLSAAPYVDYSRYSELDSTQLYFTVEKCYKPANHLICMGQGNLSERAILHLFADKNKGIQQYTKKNLVNSTLEYAEESGVIVKGRSDGTYDVSGTAATKVTVVLGEAELENGIQYTMSGGIKNVRLELLDNTGNSIQTDEGSGATFTSSGGAHSIAIVIRKGVDCDDIIIRPMVETGSVIHSYTSYHAQLGPIQDSDYILDKAHQLFFGTDEITETYDYPSSELKENYRLLHICPDNWKKSYADCYQLTKDSKYEALESWEDDVYTLQTAKPSDWASNYTDYFYKTSGKYENIEQASTAIYTAQKSEPSDWREKYESYFTRDLKEDTEDEYEYNKVKSAETETYVLQTSKPKDWEDNFDNYFYYYTDGVGYTYKKVDGDTEYLYVMQTTEPTDWNEKWTSYYYREASNGKMETLDNDAAPAWEPNSYYTRYSNKVAWKWEKGKYYTKVTTIHAPTWGAGLYYTKTISHDLAWEAGKYYTKTVETFIPEWKPGIYYEKVIDRFANLVEYGLKEFIDLMDRDALTVELDESESYDIGDVVGARENVSGIFMSKTISKKIVTITQDIITISHEVGDLNGK